MKRNEFNDTHTTRMFTRSILVITTAVLLSACGGSDEPSPQEPNSGGPRPPQGDDDGAVTTPRFDANSAGATAFPVVMSAAHQLRCESDANNPLLGCYVSEICHHSGAGSQLMLTEFSSSRGVRNVMLAFDSAQSCSGSFMEVGMSAFNLDDLRFGEPITSAEGLTVTPLEATHSLSPFQATRYTIAWLDGTSRVCFAEGDLPEDDQSVGVPFLNTLARQSPTNSINFNNCLLRLN